MILQTKKVASLLLLIVFLATSMGSAFGFVSCDCGCLSEIHHNNHQDDNHPADSQDHLIPASYPYFDDNVDTCFDYPIELSSVVLKDTVSIKTPPLITFSDSFDRSLTFTRFNSSHLNSSLTQRFGMSQTILAHRTVVLLN